MKQKYTPTEDEVACFRELMDGVQRIHSDKVEHQFPKPSPIPVQTLNDEAMVMRDLLNTAHSMIEVQPGDSLEYIREGLPKSVMRKLRKGQYRTQSELDLHGMSAVETLKALSQFMQSVCGTESCCVRIIHGKGRGSSNHGPVLKPLVYHWLKKREEVLAFTSARPVDGGTGALYVLLKWRSKH
jgi:DNA-nicking Smr family endonuclease